MVLGGPAFLHFVVLSSFCLRVSESQSLGSLGSLRVSGMLYSTSLNPMFFKNIANVGSFHFHFHFRIWRIWKIWKSGKSEIKENWKVIWQKPRESRSLGSLGVLGVSGVSGVSAAQTVNCTIAKSILLDMKSFEFESDFGQLAMSLTAVDKFWLCCTSSESQ